VDSRYLFEVDTQAKNSMVKTIIFLSFILIIIALVLGISPLTQLRRRHLKNKAFSLTFFEKPDTLKRKHPELYYELKRYYKLDPTEWMRELI
jgi:preprotein translocase subunit SecG